MFSSFKNKPDAQEIIRDDPAAGGKNITQRIMDSVEIKLAREKPGNSGTEQFKAPDFNDSTKPPCYDKE